MGAIASQITSLTIVYSTDYSGTDQSIHQSSASLAFVWGIHRGPVNSPHKWPVTRKMFPFDDVIMVCSFLDLNVLYFSNILFECVPGGSRFILWTFRSLTNSVYIRFNAYVVVFCGRSGLWHWCRHGTCELPALPALSVEKSADESRFHYVWVFVMPLVVVTV